jgi:hypothetical protein
VKPEDVLGGEGDQGAGRDGDERHGEDEDAESLEDRVVASRHVLEADTKLARRVPQSAGAPRVGDRGSLRRIGWKLRASRPPREVALGAISVEAKALQD